MRGIRKIYVCFVGGVITFFPEKLGSYKLRESYQVSISQRYTFIVQIPTLCSIPQHKNTVMGIMMN